MKLKLEMKLPENITLGDIVTSVCYSLTTQTGPGLRPYVSMRRRVLHGGVGVGTWTVEAEEGKPEFSPLTKTLELETVLDLMEMFGNSYVKWGDHIQTWEEDSRARMDHVIKWANEFNKKYAGFDWGVDEGPDYLEAVEEFFDGKIKMIAGDDAGKQPLPKYFVQPVIEIDYHCQAFQTDTEAQETLNRYHEFYPESNARLMWSVYKRLPDGTVKALSDHPSREDAEALLAELLTK